MAEPILNASRVVAGIGQGVAAGVPEHVGVDRGLAGQCRASSAHSGHWVKHSVPLLR